MQIETGTSSPPHDYQKYDSPDLWVRCQAATNHLYSETDFSVKYRASAPDQAIGLSGADSTGAEMWKLESDGQEREPEQSSMEQDLSVVASVKLPTVNPAAWTAGDQRSSPSNPPSSHQDLASEKPDNQNHNSLLAQESPPQARVKALHPSIALYIAPHLRPAQDLRFPQRQRYRTSRPYRPIPGRSESKQAQVSSEVQPSFFKSHLVIPPPHPSQLRQEIKHPPAQPQSRSSSPSPPPEVKQTQSPQRTEKTELDKMSDTGSDEIMLGRGNKFRGKQQKPNDQAESSQRSGERAHRKGARSRRPPKLHLESESTIEKQESAEQGKVSGGVPAAEPDREKQERKEELRRLQHEIVQNAHLNRFKNLDCDTANPEALAKCREGPGTDPKSEFYQVMAHRRREGETATVAAQTSSSTSGSSSSAAAAEENAPLDPTTAHVRQWEAYIQSPHIYPIVEDRQLHLSPTPTPEHEHIERQMEQHGIDPANAQIDKDMPRPDNKWTDAFYADWEFRPRAYSSLEAFRDWFRRWLDTTIQYCCYADIYHEAFFDGTAHPDGVRTMYIPNWKVEDAFLDKSDETNMLHAHETAEGYCHNWVRHTRRQEEERTQKDLNRQAYIEAMRSPPGDNPHSPKANIYLRPAQFEDSHGILQILNWYAENSSLSTDFRALETGDVRQRIENCQTNRLPFIVAVERRTGPARDSLPEQIVGYALAIDHVGLMSSGRFTAELQVFVKPGFKRQGVGRCLIDKLLEVCDPTYIPRAGYHFSAAFDDQPKFHAGGCRRLARLIFAIGYRSDRRAEVEWLKEWLLDKYGFEEHAVFKGTRVKFDHFNDVSYLFRTIAYTSNTKFEY